MQERMNTLRRNPGYMALWGKVLAGFREISGKGWEARADYAHFWPLVNRLYAMAYGPKACLPDELKGPLAFMFAGHAGRVRKGIRARPYFHHILMVVYLAWVLDLPLHIQKAACCHDDREDIPENLDVPVEFVDDILLFTAGEAAWLVVKNLTNQDHPGGKHAGQLEKIAHIPLLDGVLKLLDRLANLFDMRQDKPKDFGPERIAEECRKAMELIEAMPEAAPEHVLALLAFGIHLLKQENNLLAEVDAV